MEQDWTINQETGRANSSEIFRHLVKQVEGIIRDNGPDLINGRAGAVADVIVWNLAYKHGLTPKTPTEADWKMGLAKVIEGILRISGSNLINGRADTVAGVIMERLAHKHGLAPKS